MAGIQLTAVVQRKELINQSFIRELGETFFMGLGGIILFSNWDPLPTKTVFREISFKIDSDDILHVNQIGKDSVFREAGAQATIWKQDGNPVHVLQPPVVVQKLMGREPQPQVSG